MPKYIGLWSGAGIDGVDAALVKIGGGSFGDRLRGAAGRIGEPMRPRLVHSLHHPYPESLRRRLREAACGACQSAAELAALDRDVGEHFADAGAEVLMGARNRASGTAGVGMSGQELGVHRPAGPNRAAVRPAVLETGSPAVVATRLNLPVAARFAASDVAAGGVGGPISAWADWLTYRDARSPTTNPAEAPPEALSRVVVHLGGVASLVFLPAGAAASDVLACDTGPGTLLIDALVRELFGRATDTDGALAGGGRLQPALLHELLAGEYLRRSGPKHTVTDEWSDAQLQRVRLMAGKHRTGGRDLLATVTELTARSVAGAIAELTERPHQVILTGGGALNIHLAGRIRTLCSPSSTVTSAKFGIEPRAARAVGMAILAAGRVQQFPTHCHNATGAEKAVVLGSLTRP